MSIDEINNTIAELEKGETTFVACQKLASLYIVREHYKGTSPDSIETELNDILPAYREYCQIKGQFQRNLLPMSKVTDALFTVCDEIKDLVQLIYSNSDMDDERVILISCLHDLQAQFQESE